MNNVYIQTIDHKDQRYETVGDWYQGQLWGEDGGEVSGRECNGDTDIISISKIGNWRYEILVGIHELVELILCRHAGVSEESVTEFDEAFEAARINAASNAKDGWFHFMNEWYEPNAEPGDSLLAPYYMQHQTATYVERLIARKLGVDWTTYEKALEEVGNAPSTPA